MLQCIFYFIVIINVKSLSPMKLEFPRFVLLFMTQNVWRSCYVINRVIVSIWIVYLYLTFVLWRIRFQLIMKKNVLLYDINLQTHSNLSILGKRRKLYRFLIYLLSHAPARLLLITKSKMLIWQGVYALPLLLVK